MNIVLIFIWIWAAMIATSFWESRVEGRNAWDKGKHGWKIKYKNYVYLTAYHFWLFWVMYPLLLTLPLVIYGFDLKLVGIIISAYASGIIIEDFMWYVVNPAVKLKEFHTNFSNYFIWIKIGGKKIIPLGYVTLFLVSLLSWHFLWRI